MEPQEIDVNHSNSSLHGLVFFTGLDLSGNLPQHSTIFNTFVDLKRERPVQIKYKMLTSSDELFRRASLSVGQQREKFTGESPALPRHPLRGLIKRRWTQKYLEERPALIVAFADLDWDSPGWFEKRTQCESKISSLRQSIGQREVRLALVLIQRQKTSLEDPIAAEKAMEICQHCRISSRHLYVLPLLQSDESRSSSSSSSSTLLECAGRLEMAFHEIAQDAYQATFKRIRARSVPNNDQQLLLRQQFKLAFISELREDRHSALRYYKQSFQICAELDVPDVDAYEIFTVAGLLNYKVCELNFLLNSPVEALNQFRKHTTAFLRREPGVYPSRELAAIESSWWKAQQCRLFAELFSRAVANGLAAYASQNPGRFLEEAATHQKRANGLVRQLRQRLPTGNEAGSRQTPPMGGDPLQSFDLHSPTLYLGQRPWRSPASFRASSEPSNVRPHAALAPVVGNQQLLEHTAKQFLERNVRENYAHSLQLFSLAIAQFKRYHCEHFASLAYLDMADEYIASGQFPKALQILRHVCAEQRHASFRPFMRDVLVKAANAAFCMQNMNEWIWALAQLLHSELWKKEESGVSASMADEIHEESWMGEAHKFLAGESRMPFPVPQKDSLFPREEIDLARQKWHQLLLPSATSPAVPQQFQLNLSSSRAGTFVAFLDCKMRFLTAQWPSNGTPIVHAGELVPAEVILRNNSRLPINFLGASLFLDQICRPANSKSTLELVEWHSGDGPERGGQVLPPNGAARRLLFLFRPTLRDVQQQQQIQQQNRAQSPSSSAVNRRCELDIYMRRFSLTLTNGTFLWELEPMAQRGRAETAPSEMTSTADFDSNSLAAIKILPQQRRIQLKGPGEGVQQQLFTDESIECTFTLLNNNIGDEQKQPSEDLKNIRVLCQKVYREEELLTQQQMIVQHTFDGTSAGCGTSPTPHQHTQLASGTPSFGQAGHTLVPVFNQEVATFLGQNESTDFFVRLQSKSSNCVALQVQVHSLLSASGEPVEWVENFPITCLEPFKVETSIYCENGEKSQCLVIGQRYRLEVDIQAAKSIKMSSIQWKLNTPALRACSHRPLTALLSAQLDKLKIQSPNATGTEAEGIGRRREEAWVQVPEGKPNGKGQDGLVALGEVLVEWSSTNSCEPVRSLLNFGQMPVVSCPVIVQAELLPVEATENDSDNEEHGMCLFEVGRPFQLQFSMWNGTGEGGLPLAVQISFDQIDGLIFAGIKEDNVLLFADGEAHSFMQTVVPLCPGELAFPMPQIRCTTTLPGRPQMELASEELDRLNRLIQKHTYGSLPRTFFVMVSFG